MAKINGKGQARTYRSMDELIAITNEMTPATGSVILLSYHCCSRVGEVLRLKAEYVIGGELIFPAEITKCNKQREYPIDDAMSEILSKLPNKGLLFPGRSGTKPMTPNAVEKQLKRACDYLDSRGSHRGFSLHSGRRTMANNMMRGGSTLKELMDYGGWSSLTSVQRYLDTTAEDKLRAKANAVFPAA
ncbi:site-specific integrase [filamentous cyanobacterium LEGE 11480]|uniref:Site-specific integrase n=1 Tax=Romeriopsis navalis LEGE 11480 TaxID=2777977 RepID=A0A928VRV0_9CYAN|nr:site-specific integrase [Romeriopsis navalis]MBE9031811.1 site-specific integrase [Romeriopsis navalis LEGE 11480]